MMIVLPSQIFHTALVSWSFCLVFCYSQNMFLCWISIPSLLPNQEMTILQIQCYSKFRSALYRIINCQQHRKVLISSFHVQSQKLQKHNFKIKTLSLRIKKRRAGQETHVLSKMYLTFLDHNALCSFIEDMIPPVKTKLVSSIITNLHTKWNKCQSNKKSHPVVWVWQAKCSNIQFV